MRRLIIVLVLVATSARISMATGDCGVFATYFSQAGESGYAGGAKVDMEVTKTLWMELRGVYGQGGDVKALGFGLVGRLPMDQVTPFVGAGGGWFIYDIDSPITIDPVFGFYAVVGLQKDIARNFILFLEGQYAQAEYSESETTIETGWFDVPNVGRVYGTRTTTTEVSGGLDGLGANIGIAWKF